MLAQFAATPFVDVADSPLAVWSMQHEAEVAVLEAHREQAVPRLLEQRSASAAYALALLGVADADPWFRELLFDTTQYGWESGCTYQPSSVGQVALEHLHQQPARALIKVKPAQRKAWRKAAAAADQLEGMDRWCGEGGHARIMLAIFEGEDE